MAGAETNKDFLVMLEDTNVRGARFWIKSFETIISRDFETRAVTDESATSIAFWIASEILNSLRRLGTNKNDPPYIKVFNEGHAFLLEICEKARRLGLTVNIDRIDEAFFPVRVR